jgi:hypothetical protein
MQHPKRDYSLPIWEWLELCTEAHQCRTSFIREHMTKTVFDNEVFMNLKQCILYGEHEYHSDITPSKEFSELSQKLSQPLSHIDTLSPPKKRLKYNPLKYIVFDTESTGTSKNDIIIQLGYVAYDERFNEISTYEKIWKSDRKSNKFALQIHGISDKQISSSPYNLKMELKKFLELVSELKHNNGVLVAHNAAFDMRMLRQSASYSGMLWDEKLKAFCTMLALKKRSECERGINCKNEQVYQFLGGKPLGKMHTALIDATATAYIYRCGLDRNWWF